MVSNQNYYSESWKLYKAHTDGFLEDLEYYFNFCKGHKSLELFAGYGRLANPLLRRGVDLDTVELEPNFAKHIQLPKERNFVANVLEFSKPGYARIFAAYNSFCLLRQDDELRTFFKNIEASLVPGGKVSLSYYHHKNWKNAAGSSLEVDGKHVLYAPSYDLSQSSNGFGKWIDEYHVDGQTYRFEYPTRVFEGENDVLKFTEGTTLKLSAIIFDYGHVQMEDPGWVEYVFVRC